MKKVCAVIVFMFSMLLGGALASAHTAEARTLPIPFEYVEFNGTEWEGQKESLMSAYPYYICCYTRSNDKGLYYYYLFPSTDVVYTGYSGNGYYYILPNVPYYQVECDKYLNVSSVKYFENTGTETQRRLSLSGPAWSWGRDDYVRHIISPNFSIVYQNDSSSVFWGNGIIPVSSVKQSSISASAVKGCLDYPPFPSFVRERYKNIIIFNQTSENAIKTGPVFYAYNDGDLIIRWGDSKVMAVDAFGNEVPHIKGYLGPNVAWVFDNNTDIGRTSNETYSVPYIYYTSAPLYKQKEGQTANIKGETLVSDPLEFSSNYKHFLDTPTAKEMFSVLPDELMNYLNCIVFRQEYINACSDKIIFYGWQPNNATLKINGETSQICAFDGSSAVTDWISAYYDTGTKTWVISDELPLGATLDRTYSLPNIFYSSVDLELANADWSSSGTFVYMADQEMPGIGVPEDEDDSFIGKILSGLTSLFKKLFVPSPGFFDSKINTMKSKFSFYDAISSTGTAIFDFFAETDFTEPPKITVDLSASRSKKYNYGDTAVCLDMSWYEEYKPYVDVFLSGVIWLTFAWNTFKNLPSIISGVVTALNVSTSIADATASKPADMPKYAAGAKSCPPEFMGKR